jgi:hypothetical protein
MGVAAKGQQESPIPAAEPVARPIGGEELGLVSRLKAHGPQLIAATLERMGQLGAHDRGQLRVIPSVVAKQALAAQLQLTKLKGFDQIVVRPGLQPHHPIAGCGQGRKYQDRKSMAECANSAEHIDTMFVRKEQINKE